MDLAGPKLRTGPLEPGPAVIKVKPTRDAFGRVTRPARVWLSARESPRQPPTPADAAIEFPDAFLKALTVGDDLALADARGSKRVLSLVALGADGAWAESTRTCYFTTDLRVRARREGAGIIAEACIGAMPHLETSIALATGDRLTLTRELAPGRPAVFDQAGRVLIPATIGCTSSQVFEDAQAGERLHIRVTHARARGAKLVADKGINLPDSHLHLAAMTDKDRADLAFVANHADMVALSFANAVEDVSHRAECVMLNKGPYVMEAVHVLDDILCRMHGHQEKKRSVLRQLHLVSTFRQTLKARSQTDAQVVGSSR